MINGCREEGTFPTVTRQKEILGILRLKGFRIKIMNITLVPNILGTTECILKLYKSIFYMHQNLTITSIEFDVFWLVTIAIITNKIKM